MDTRYILVVEDEFKIAALLRDYLEQAHFRVSVLARGDHVLPFVHSKKPDLILLDIMVPGMDGIEICRELRKTSNLPVIMLTAKVEEIDRLIGLEIGADDYICKPFSPREVVARVKAVLRRTNPQIENEIISIENLELNISNFQVTVAGQELTLTKSEFGLLKILMTHPQRVFSRSELIYQVQGYTYEGYERTIDSHIKNLRKKIAEILPEKEIISSVYGIGYKLNIPD